MVHLEKKNKKKTKLCVWNEAFERWIKRAEWVKEEEKVLGLKGRKTELSMNSTAVETLNSYWQATYYLHIYAVDRPDLEKHLYTRN